MIANVIIVLLTLVVMVLLDRNFKKDRTIRNLNSDVRFKNSQLERYKDKINLPDFNKNSSIGNFIAALHTFGFNKELDVQSSNAAIGILRIFDYLRLSTKDATAALNKAIMLNNFINPFHIKTTIESFNHNGQHMYFPIINVTIDGEWIYYLKAYTVKAESIVTSMSSGSTTRHLPYYEKVEITPALIFETKGGLFTGRVFNYCFTKRLDYTLLLPTFDLDVTLYCRQENNTPSKWFNFAIVDYRSASMNYIKSHYLIRYVKVEALKDLPIENMTTHIIEECKKAYNAKVFEVKTKA